eukprot:scaffold57857_cov31-Tisochrysis_lutea.AAC.4
MHSGERPSACGRQHKGGTILTRNCVPARPGCQEDCGGCECCRPLDLSIKPAAKSTTPPVTRVGKGCAGNTFVPTGNCLEDT